MPFTYPSDFISVWNALADQIKAKSIFAGGDQIKAAYSYFNTAPELRNPTNQPRFPGIVMTTRSPTRSPEWVVQEGIRRTVTVVAASPYLEGVKADTIALADGQTIEIKRGFWNGTAPDEEVLTATFLTASFADITAATPAEIAAVLNALTGVSATIPTGNTVRITHDDTGGYAYLQVTGGTAAALLATFPDYEVVGREAGDEIQSLNPVSHYDFAFQLATLAARPDHHWILKRFIEALFREARSPTERSCLINTKKFELVTANPVDDPDPAEGTFATIYPFTLKRIPIAWDADQYEGDNYLGGNYDGTGINPRNQGPVIVEFVFNLDALEQCE